ncbi:hypothetical protein VE00_07912 [Pseudogymnoascus sp. WSF 3629]|nr:hypothetical protein VE00_07912 [Pseudogymnoascus sp. WSF 3629]
MALLEGHPICRTGPPHDFNSSTGEVQGSNRFIPELRSSRGCDRHGIDGPEEVRPSREELGVHPNASGLERPIERAEDVLRDLPVEPQHQGLIGRLLDAGDCYRKVHSVSDHVQLAVAIIIREHFTVPKGPLPACHNKLYLAWRTPDIGQDTVPVSAASKIREAITSKMNSNIRAELRRQIDGRYAKKAAQYDSVTGTTSSINVGHILQPPASISEDEEDYMSAQEYLPSGTTSPSPYLRNVTSEMDSDDDLSWYMSRVERLKMARKQAVADGLDVFCDSFNYLCASPPFDINQDGLRFVSAILGYLWVVKTQWDFDPTILEADGKDTSKSCATSAKSVL